MITPVMITPDWPAPSRVRAAFTLRSGGVSEPPYDSLNLGASVGDSWGAVAENRRRLRERLRLPSEPLWLRQVHGIHVLRADALAAGAPMADADAPIADAAVTPVAGRVLAVQVADCMPVLLCDRQGTMVGAAHAGWRGLSAGVLEAVIGNFPVPATQLTAWLGPTISTAHFEVGEEVRQAFLARDPGATVGFCANPRGRWRCDLYELARRRLSAAGVLDVYGGTWCTYQDAERFFSFRRDGVCGRMAALIWLEPAGPEI